MQYLHVEDVSISEYFPDSHRVHEDLPVMAYEPPTQTENVLSPLHMHPAVHSEHSLLLLSKKYKGMQVQFANILEPKGDTAFTGHGSLS